LDFFTTSHSVRSLVLCPEKFWLTAARLKHTEGVEQPATQLALASQKVGVEVGEEDMPDFETKFLGVG
jgi:hypothetical protein